jgi:hypothetical protein
MTQTVMEVAMMATVVELAIQSTPCGIQKIRRWVAAGVLKKDPSNLPGYPYWSRH